MGDLGDYFRDVKEAGKEKRWSNYEYSKNLLIEKGVQFEELSAIAGHFRIGEYDFWATTGLFIHRKTKKRGRGIRNLLKRIQ